MTVVQCERFFVESIVETRYDPALGIGSPTWDETVIINAWNGRVRALPEISATASNSPGETYTREENLDRMTGWLEQRVLEVFPDATFEWTDVPPWQGNRA